MIERLECVKGWQEGINVEVGYIFIEVIWEGDVKGMYEICYVLVVDIFIICYEVYSWEGFVRGVLQVVYWLIGKKGVFGMWDMLGL